MASITNNNDNNNNGKMPVKLLEGDGFFFDRLLLKDNSIGNSSRIDYRSATDGVPFQWERAPGTPKHELKNEVIPPLTPPPAAQSKGLPPRPKYSVEQSKESAGNNWKANWFWKKSKKKKRDCDDHAIHRSVSCDVNADDKFEMEFMGSSFLDSSSSASSSSSSWNRASLSSEVGLPRDPLESRYFCSPWNITAILVRVARRV